ncbi:hypothetical protein [Sodalis sp.]|uniref:hypothetical protein n=1 Tax=Sodalis sp. (in: enterobacteria) TaxID=1898979 RepID=UPI003872DAED
MDTLTALLPYRTLAVFRFVDRISDGVDHLHVERFQRPLRLSSRAQLSTVWLPHDCQQRIRPLFFDYRAMR